MATDNETAKDPRPAYMPFGTLMNLAERMADEGMPTRIDKSYLSNQSGGVQSQILTGLRFLGLMGENGILTDEFKRLVSADEDERRQVIGDLLRARYPQVVELGTKNSTQAELEETFEAMDVKGETRRKAVAFYLKAADYAGMPKSKNWSVPRVHRAGKRRKSTSSRGASDPPTHTPAPASQGETIEVSLGSAGSVTLNVKVRWLDLPDEVFIGLRNLTKELRALGDNKDDLDDDEEERDV